uniref:Uncharacterized protein n=1 Tax=Sipha flava TaxID=143950 RepID=A0A2S2PVA7_9HEMI
MAIFNAEYIPELKWITVEPHNMIVNKADTKNHISKHKYSNDISDQHHNIIDDFQSILYIIKLIEKMIKYNNMYYERIEKRRKQQNLELQGLAIFLQNICTDLNISLD